MNKKYEFFYENTNHILRRETDNTEIITFDYISVFFCTICFIFVYFLFFRLYTSQTLSTLDTVIFCVAQSAKITLTLPTNAENGQIYFIKKATSPDFVVTAGGRDYIMTNSSTKSITVSNKHLIILIYDKVNGLWMFGLANE